MSTSNESERLALECLRLTADCMQLARDAPNPAWKAHFVRRARLLQALADRVPKADIGIKSSIDPADTQLRLWSFLH